MAIVVSFTETSSITHLLVYVASSGQVPWTYGLLYMHTYILMHVFMYTSIYVTCGNLGYQW